MLRPIIVFFGVWWLQVFFSTIFDYIHALYCSLFFCNWQYHISDFCQQESMIFSTKTSVWVWHWQKLLERILSIVIRVAKIQEGVLLKSCIVIKIFLFSVQFWPSLVRLQYSWLLHSDQVWSRLDWKQIFFIRIQNFGRTPS